MGKTFRNDNNESFKKRSRRESHKFKKKVDPKFKPKKPEDEDFDENDLKKGQWEDDDREL